MPRSSESPSPSARLVSIPPLRQPLAREWRFRLDPSGEGVAQGWFQPSWPDSSWAGVDIPHTWNADPEHAGYEGLAWYRRRLILPDSAHQSHLSLRFGAVNYLARVWLNGESLAEHEGGYTPFELSLDGCAKPGAENLLAIQVDNLRAMDRLPAALPEGRSFGWHNYGGIVRPVVLQATSRAFLDAARIVAVPRLVEPDCADWATVTATVLVRNLSAESLDGSLESMICADATGEACLPRPQLVTVRVSAGATDEIVLTAELPAPQLWHFDHPHLYRWSFALLSGSGLRLHSLETTFGIRSVELKGGSLLLNGEAVRLVGVSRHADVPGLGLAETDEAAAADYADLKRLNQVLTRPVHYPQSDFVLDYCDRHGVLLIPEVPAWQLTANQMADSRIRTLERQQLAEMVRSEWNHPSVCAWSVGNELESDTAAGREFVREMISFAKSLDPTRPVGFASYHLLGGRPWADATVHADFVMMNEYFGTWHGPRQSLGPALDLVHATWPDKTVIVSEFGYAPNWPEIEGPGQISPDQYYGFAEDDACDVGTADLLRQRVILEHMQAFRSRPFVAGAVFWTYQDHGSGLYGMGIVDEQRRRKGSWEVLRQEYAPIRIVSVVPLPGADAGRGFAIDLRARGPLQDDMPAYTLRGYRLHWAVLSSLGGTILREGEVPLPKIAPGQTWSGVAKERVSTGQVVRFSVRRPTGFAAAEVTVNARGEPADAPPFGPT